MVFSAHFLIWDKFVSWNFSERCGVVIFYSNYSDWEIERSRKSEVESGMNCTVFCSPDNVSKFLQTIFYYTKYHLSRASSRASSSRNLQSRAPNATGRRTACCYRLTFYRAFFKDFPRKREWSEFCVQPTVYVCNWPSVVHNRQSSVYNRQSICLQMTDQ